MEEIELAQLHEALIDNQTLATLFDDLHAHARVLEVRLKASADYRTQPGNVSLDHARAALLEGALRSAQIRYLFDGSEWRDTLIRMPAGWKIVRIDHTPKESGA